MITPLLSLLVWLASRVPIPVASVWARGVALIWWYILPFRKALAVSNVRRAFPEFTHGQIRRTLLDMMYNITLSYVELLVFERTRVRLPVEGSSQVPPGSLVVAAHAGAWDIGLLSLAAEIPLATFLRTPKNVWVRDRMAAIRQNHGLMGLETGTTLADGYAALESGRSLMFIQDQRHNNGILSPFFGHPCKTSPGLGVVHLKTGRPVYACWQVRLGPGKHRFWCVPMPLHAPTGDRTADVQAITDACNAYYASKIREFPSGWLWLHDRWR